MHYFGPMVASNAGKRPVIPEVACIGIIRDIGCEPGLTLAPWTLNADRKYDSCHGPTSYRYARDLAGRRQ